MLTEHARKRSAHGDAFEYMYLNDAMLYSKLLEP